MSTTTLDAPAAPAAAASAPATPLQDVPTRPDEASSANTETPPAETPVADPTKSRRSEIVAAVKIGATDLAGSLIVDVLSSQDEFSIYEVEINGNKRIKVLIDSNDKEREDFIITKYNEIKREFISAVGILYNARNVFSAKYMVAQALSYHLSPEPAPRHMPTEDARNETGKPKRPLWWFKRHYKEPDRIVKSKKFFGEVLTIINDQVNDIPKRRALYLMPFWLTVTCYLYAIIDGGNTQYDLAKLTLSQKMHALLFASAIGGMLSATININKSPLDYIMGKKICVLLGLERFFVSIGSSLVAFIAIESGYILPALKEGNFLGVMALAVIAAFSEKFIPSFIEKMENRVQSADGKNDGAKPPTPSPAPAPAPTGTPT